MPDRTPLRTLEDEAGRHYVVLDSRGRRRLWLGLSTWQWAVVGAYLVAIVLSIALAIRGEQIDSNARKVQRSICAQAIYLDGVKSRDPVAQARLDKLVRELRALNRECPASPPERPGPGG